MFGRFLELAIATQDILASVQFYERLGFEQLPTGDAWPHRYGVVGNGTLAIGLHERTGPAVAVSFVLPQLVAAQSRLREAGFELHEVELGPDRLHHLWLRDPGEHSVLLQEVRTFSPASATNARDALCGDFLHLSLPQSDFTRATQFWERGGLVALPPEEHPYPHLPLTGDALTLAFHTRVSTAATLLVFACPDLERAREAFIAQPMPAAGRPAGRLAPAGSLVVRAPEGTLLLLVPQMDPAGTD